jgi:hypothetical protein
MQCEVRRPLLHRTLSFAFIAVCSYTVGRIKRLIKEFWAEVFLEKGDPLNINVW